MTVRLITDFVGAEPEFMRKPEIKAILVAVLADGGTREAACRAASITVRKLNSWLAEAGKPNAHHVYRDFAHDVACAEDGVELTCLRTIMMAVRDGNVSAALKLLAMKWPERYGDRIPGPAHADDELDFSGSTEEELEIMRTVIEKAIASTPDARVA